MLKLFQNRPQLKNRKAKVNPYAMEINAKPIEYVGDGCGFIVQCNYPKDISFYRFWDKESWIGNIFAVAAWHVKIKSP